MVSHGASDPVNVVAQSFPSADIERLRFALVISVVPRVLQATRLTPSQSQFLSGELSARTGGFVSADRCAVAAGQSSHTSGGTQSRERKARLTDCAFRPSLFWICRLRQTCWVKWGFQIRFPSLKSYLAWFSVQKVRRKKKPTIACFSFGERHWT